MNAFVIPDLSGEITGAVSGLDTELLAVVGAGIGLAVVTYGARRAWSTFKSFR